MTALAVVLVGLACVASFFAVQRLGEWRMRRRWRRQREALRAALHRNYDAGRADEAAFGPRRRD